MKNRIPSPTFQMPQNGSDPTTWALPRGAISRLGHGYIQDITCSPDDKYLVVGTRLGLWWYDLSTGAPIALWETERGLVSAVTFSPCGKWLAAGNWDGRVKVWDAAQWDCTAQMEPPWQQRRRISALVFSPDGQHLAASDEREPVVNVWNPKTGEETASFSGTTAYRNCRLARPLAFSRDSCLLACAIPEDTDPSADRISIWNVLTGEEIACLRGHSTLICAVSFSPCGQFLVSGDRLGTLRVWDIPSAKTVRVYSDYTEKYRVVPSYSPWGALLAAAVEKSTLTIWDVDRFEKLDTFEHRGDIRALCFSNGTRLAVASHVDFKVWKAETTPAVFSIAEHAGHISGSLRFSSDGRRLVSTEVGAVNFWDITTKQPQWIRHAKANAMTVSIAGPNGNVCALGTDKNNVLYAWNVKTNKTITTFTAHQKNVYKMAASATGELFASAHKDGKVYVWSNRGKQTACIRHIDPVLSLAFSPDEKYLVSASSERTARVWEVASGEEVVSLVLTPLPHIDLYKGDPLEIQKRSKSLAKSTSRSRPQQIQTLVFSRDGVLIVGGILREIRFWDATTYEVRMSILLPDGCWYPYALAFSPCGRYLASGSWWQWTEKVSIRLWDVATGENIHTFWGHSTDVQALAFSPDGTLLASGSYDGTILLWDMTPYLPYEPSKCD